MPELLICVSRKDFPSQIPHLFFLPDDSPIVLCGPVELLQRKKVLLLNSRQSPHLNMRNDWMKRTLQALHSLDPRRTVIMSSLGLTPWEFLSWAAAKMGFPLILIFPAGSAQNFNIARTKAILDLGLEEKNTLALRPLSIGPKDATNSSLLRDCWVLALSDEVYPISIRSGGNFARYLNDPELPSLSVQSEYKIDYEPAPNVKRVIQLKNPTIPEWLRVDDYLYHWTRSCIGPWLDESHAEYFERVIAKDSHNSGGLCTLQRILEEGLIRASGRLIRGKYPMVTFTEKSPQHLPELLRWRSGLRRWTFEPYGVAIKKAKLIQLGTRPVKYGEVSDFERLSEGDRPFFQLAASGKLDWRLEKEWRVLGDLSLNVFQPQDILVLVPSADEVASLMQVCQYRIVSLSG